ncbi:hypothetical protein AB6A23_03250 [Paenibacillus tarimensis]
MEPILPLEEGRISQFCGQLVCAVTKDGKRYVGLLSRCSGGKITLNEEAAASGKVNLANKPRGKNRRRRKAAALTEEAQTQAWGPYGPAGFYPFGPVVVLELALLASLFLLL